MYKTRSHHGHQQTQQSKSQNQILKYVSDGSGLAICLVLFTIREKPSGSYVEVGVGWVLFSSSSFLRMHWGSWKSLKCCVKRTRHPQLQRQSLTEHPGWKKPSRNLNCNLVGTLNQHEMEVANKYSSPPKKMFLKNDATGNALHTNQVSWQKWNTQKSPIKRNKNSISKF